MIEQQIITWHPVPRWILAVVNLDEHIQHGQRLHTTSPPTNHLNLHRFLNWLIYNSFYLISCVYIYVLSTLL